MYVMGRILQRHAEDSAMTKVYPINTGLTTQTVTLPGAPGGSLKCYLSFSTAPTGGTVTAEYRLSGGDWQPVAHVQGYDATEQVIPFRLDGPVAAVRLSLSGLSGASSASLIVDRQFMPVDSFNGLAAIVTQPYTEANVKNGLEYYIRSVWPLTDTIASGATRKIYIETGSKALILKLREIAFVAEELMVRIFHSPEGVTGGTALTVHNYNRVNPIATTIADARKNVSTTSDGTEFNNSDPEYYFGASQQNMRAAGAFPDGRERILPDNTGYIISIQNTGSGTARANLLLDWYEGIPDLPL